MFINARDRFLRAGKRDTVDRPPCICPGGMMNMIIEDVMDISAVAWPEAHSDADKMAALTAAAFDNGGFENYGVPFCLTVEAEAMGAAVDLGSKIVEPHITDEFLKEAADWYQLKPLELDQGRVKVMLDAIRILKSKSGDVPVIGNISGPLTVAGSLMDYTKFLKEMRRSPDHIKMLLSIIVKNLIILAKAQIKAGADAICISEPSGTGEILGKKWFKEYTIHYVNKILKSIDAPLTMVHICGELKSVYDLLPELQCDVFSFDSLVSMAEMREVLPDKAIMGNINTHALFNQDKEKITRLVENCYLNGADIIAPACGLSTVTPLENIRTMVDAAKNYVY